MKKSMKRMLSLISVVVCVVMLTVTATAAGTDAYTIYANSQKKMAKVTSMELQSTTKTAMSIEGLYEEEVDRSTAVMKVVMKGKSMEMEAKITGADKSVQYAYYKDGSLYVKQGSKKYKVKMKYEEAMMAAGNLDMGLAKEQLKDATVEKVQGGNKIRYVTDLDDIKDSSGKSLAEVLEEQTSEIGFRIRGKDIISTMTIGDDGMVQGYASAFTMSARVSDVLVKIKYNASGKVLSYNKVTKINFPNDLNTYTALI